MAVFSAQELLQRHSITYVETRKGKFTTKCPNCSDNYLSVEIKNDGVVWFCQSCQEGSGEKFEQGKAGELGPIKAIYDYTDESGKLLFQVLRFEPINGPKEFRQRTGPDQEKWSIKGVRIVPFHLPEVMEAIANDQTIFVCEGEKDVLTLQRLGIVATCNPMGAKKWWPEFNELLKGADVVICIDNDEPGHEHGRMVAENLIPVAKRVRLFDLARYWPKIEPSDDISDWVEQGGTVEQLWPMVEQLPTLTEIADPPRTNGKHAPRLLIMGKREFIMGFCPPDFVIEGMLQRQFVYALTGQTGHAKSAIALLLAELVSCGDPNSVLGTHRVEKGQVAYFVGENPDDIRMRVIGADSFRKDDPLADRIVFIPGVFNIEEMFAQLNVELAARGKFDLVIVDTSAAYFLGNEELSNTQMGAHARMLRSLTTLPGRPCVLVLCHPIKYANEPSQLLPRGGGAFLAEMDGNLTAFKHDDVLIELSYNKIRGPGFEPMTFKLETIRPEKLVDAKGRQISTVRAIAITETDEDHQKDKARDDEDRVLALRLRLLETDQLSYAQAAEQCGWVSADGAPQKSRVFRIVDRLEKAKLMRRDRGQWLLTEKGKETARKAAARLQAAEDVRKQAQFDLQYQL